MASKRSPFRLGVSFALLLWACGDSPTESGVTVDPALNGAWVDAVQSGSVHVYVTELRFDNGSFEWTWDDDLQQRGVYDTRDGTLTVTIQSNYGYPQRSLGDPSRPYSMVGNSLTWGATPFTRK
jgi:hypothetical protein